MKKINTKALVTASLLAAMSFILTRFLYLPVAGGAVRLSLGELPIMLSGMLFGPLAGGITGFVSDFTGAMLLPQGPYFPGFTISATLVGVIPGLIFYNCKKEYPLRKIILSSVIIAIFISIGMGTYWLSILFKKGFFVLLPSRVIAKIIMTPIEIFLLSMLTKKLKNL